MLNLLSEIESLAERTVTVRGRTLTLRGLTAAESRLLEKHDPRPEPRPGLDERLRRDWLNSPEHRVALEAYVTRRMCSIIGLSAGLTNRAGEPMEAGRSKEWRAAFTEELLGGLSEQEIARVYAAYLSIYDEDPARTIGTGEAPGNSSAPSPRAGDGGTPGAESGGSCPSGTASPACTDSSAPPSGSPSTPASPSSSGSPGSRSS